MKRMTIYGLKSFSLWMMDLNFVHLSWISVSSAPKHWPHSFKVILWSELESHLSRNSAIHGSIDNRGARSGNSSWRDTNLIEIGFVKTNIKSVSNAREKRAKSEREWDYLSAGSLSKSQYFQITASTHLWAKSSWALIELNFECSDLNRLNRNARLTIHVLFRD
jgi:hypothetical protein